MTREEYMARTNITSVEQAKGYLNQLRALFIIVFLGMAARYLPVSEDAALAIFFTYWAIVIYFVAYCVKVVKQEKISKAHAAFSILFAPISWIWFYPAIMEPLEIITGKKQPPESLPPELTEEQKAAKQKEGNKKFWKTIGIVCAVAFGLMAIFTITMFLVY